MSFKLYFGVQQIFHYKDYLHFEHTDLLLICNQSPSPICSISKIFRYACLCDCALQKSGLLLELGARFMSEHRRSINNLTIPITI